MAVNGPRIVRMWRNVSETGKCKPWLLQVQTFNFQTASGRYIGAQRVMSHSKVARSTARIS